MSGLFSKPEVPQPPEEDPEVKRMRDEEQKRAEQGRIAATQDQLRQETQLRSRSRGVASLLGTFSRGRRGLTSLLGAG